MKFDIKIMGVEFESDEDGMLNLLAISKKLNKTPASQWRTKESRWLRQNAKLRSGSEIKELGKPPVPFLKADEDTTIAYAMWVDIEFYLDVIQSFRDLRRGNIQGALESAANTMSETAADKMMQVVWENLNGMKVVNQRTALQLAGIEKPIVFMRELRKRTKSYERIIDEQKIVLQTYAPNKWTDRFTQDGFQWLLSSKDSINNWVKGVQHTSKGLNKII